MHVVFFNRSFYPDISSTGNLLTDLCEDLIRDHGCRVSVITGPPLKPLGDLPPSGPGLVTRETYRGIEIPWQRVDLIVDGEIVVELKTVLRFDSIHVGQVLSYLHTTGLRGGLLINFRVPLLRMGLKRVVR